MHFASDNTSGVAPQVMAALQAANEGHVPSYGADPLSAVMRDTVRALFEAPEAQVFLVATGTAANSLSCALLSDPWSAIFCHRHAHIQEDECGAPEFFADGAKLVLLEGEHGKIHPDLMRPVIAHAGGAIHHVQRGMLSITNVTEAGTVYSVDEVRALTAIAKEYDLPVHMDGARFGNALAATGASPAEMTWKSGVDVLSFGGTKNGCMGVEAVVIFDPARAHEFELRRKRAGHLFSKNRFLAAQMLGYLAGDAWCDLAAHANAMAAKLRDGLLAMPGVDLLHPVDANILFVRLPRRVHRALRAAGAQYYLWPFEQSLEGDDDELLAARLVCSWATTEAEVDAFLSHLK